MPLKDHKQEIWCVTAVAGLLKHQAEVKRKATLNVAGALRGIVLQRLQVEVDLRTEAVAGSKWGAW